MRAQGETRELVVELTEHEVLETGEALAQAVSVLDEERSELSDWEAGVKASRESLKAKVKRLETEVSELAEIVRTGKDKRDVTCTWLYSLAAGYAFLVRDDTQELVTHRKLRDEERQMVIGEAPYREPTPEQLEDWLAALPVNEPDALGEGHAETVTPEERLVGALLDPAADESFGPSSDELTGEEQTRAYEDEIWNEDAEDDEDEVDAAIDDAIEAGEIVIPPLGEEF